MTLWPKPSEVAFKLSVTETGFIANLVKEIRIALETGCDENKSLAALQ